MRPPGHFELAHEAIDDAARRPSREGACDARLILVRVEQCLLVGLGDTGFLARDKRGAQLRAGSAERTSTAAIPRPSMIPPDATTGTRTASTIWGTSASVPIMADSNAA